MKATYIIPILSILFLTACIQEVPKDDSSEVKNLRQQVDSLKAENANLREENTLLKAWGNPTTIQSSWWSGAWDDGTTYEEWNYPSCMKKAYDEFIAQGTSECKKSGYSSVEILANKCQLDDAVMNRLKMNKANEEWSCKQLYN